MINKDSSFFRVQMVLTSSGERLPTLVSKSTGLPDFDTTLWVTTALRVRYASASIAQALRSVSLMYKALPNLIFEERLREGKWISLDEINILVEAITLKSSEIGDLLAVGSWESEKSPEHNNKVIKLENLRAKMAPNQDCNEVLPDTSSIRMLYIRKFLKWRITRKIHHSSGEIRDALIALRDLVDAELTSRVPRVTSRSRIDSRVGISREKQSLLLDIAHPASPKNKWRANEFIRRRNHLIIVFLTLLGLRRGEMLGMRVGDVKPLEQKVYVHRRPDDGDDPRIDEPNVKRLARILPINQGAFQVFQDYLITRHDVVQGKHDFLIVAIDGMPLSKSGFNRIFKPLQDVPGLEDIEPHVLRHTWAENFAEDAHNAGMDDEEIQRYLELLGGWSEGSLSVRRYTKRFAREQSDKAILKLQEKLNISSALVKEKH